MIPDERLPWFPCYPTKLLGALAAMTPDEQLVYVITILRIYEVGGAISDDDHAISRRTGLTVRRVSTAMQRLFEIGKLTKTDMISGSYTNPVAEAEIEEQRSLTTKHSAEQSARAHKRWSKDKITDMTGDLLSDEMPDDPFEEFWKAYPARQGSNPKKPARDKFEKACKRGIDPKAIIDGGRRYADRLRKDQKIGTPYVAQAQTWLHQERWKDEQEVVAAKAAAPKRFFVEYGTPQWSAWQAHYDSIGRVLSCNQFRPGGEGTPYKRGWYFPSELPPRKAETAK